MKGMTTPYLVSEYSLAELGSGWGSIAVSVLGYWSRDPITIYVRRGHDKKWEFTISHSSGGRDSAEVASDSEAVRNFAAALCAASDVATQLQEQESQLEMHYKQLQDERERVRQEQAAAKQAAIDADAALGTFKARQILERMIVEVETGVKFNNKIKAFERGSDDTVEFTVEKNRKLVIKKWGYRVSKAQALSDLADCSARELAA